MSLRFSLLVRLGLSVYIDEQWIVGENCRRQHVYFLKLLNFVMGRGLPTSSYPYVQFFIHKNIFKKCRFQTVVL